MANGKVIFYSFYLIINLFHEGEQIENFLGDGSKWDINISYFYEKELLGTNLTWISRKIESMSMDLKNAENRIKKYSKLAKLQRNNLAPKSIIFSDECSPYNGNVYFTF